MSNTPNASSRLAASIHAELNPAYLVPNILAGAIIGVLTIIVEISFAALIFSGDLSPFIGRGIGLMLFGTFAISLVVALSSSFPGTIARPHEIPAAILALAVAPIAAALASVPGQQMFVTVLAAIVATSLLTGIFFFALGHFKLGSLVRFVPYPVVGGFLAGTGWLLIKGGIGVMTDQKVNMANAAIFFSPHGLTKWVPGMLFAVALFFILRRFKHFMVMPIVLLVGVAVFYAIIAVSGASIEQARAAGWFLGPFRQGGLWEPLPIASIGLVRWDLVLAQAGKAASILLISVLPLLLNANGLELVVRRDIDFNRELKSAGIANLLAGMGGGTVGLHSLSLSALAFRMGSRGRLVGIITALVCGAALFVGPSALAYLPRPLLGGLLFYLGLCFLIEWVVESYKKLPRVDYLLVWTILLCIAAFGFLQGVGVGLLVAVALFVYNYSRVRVVKYVLTGTNFSSNVDRAATERRILTEQGERLHILKLQGYIFFGTANHLLEEVRLRAVDTTKPPLSFVVFDFSLVSGLDSSALRSFAKMNQLSEKHSFVFVFTALSQELQRQFSKSAEDETAVEFSLFADLDHGVEWCEEKILVGAGGVGESDARTLEDELSGVLSGGMPVSSFVKHLEKQETKPGRYLMRQGDPPHHLYFIESGQVTVQLEASDGSCLRLRTMGAGTVVGEMGLFMGTNAAASVVVTKPGIVYSLSAAAFKKMEVDDPETAASFHKYIIQLLGERLSHTNRSLQALLS